MLPCKILDRLSLYRSWFIMLWNVRFENCYFSKYDDRCHYKSTSLIKVVLYNHSNFSVLSMKWGMCVRGSLGTVSVVYKAACSAWCFSFGWNINNPTCALWLPSLHYNSLYIQFSWIYRNLLSFRILFSLVKHWNCSTDLKRLGEGTDGCGT